MMRPVLALIILAVAGIANAESPCEGISDEVWANMDRIAAEHFADVSSKGKTFKEIRAWLASQEPPMKLTGDQKRCWTREFGRRFDDRDKKLDELAARLAREAYEKELASLTEIEREWVSFQSSKRPAAIEEARAKLEEALGKFLIARKQEHNPSGRVGGSGPWRFAPIYTGPNVAQASAIVNRWSARLREVETNDPVFVFTISPWVRKRGAEKAMGRLNTETIDYWVYQISGPDSLIVSYKRYGPPNFSLKGIDTFELWDDQSVRHVLAPLTVRGIGIREISVFGSKKSLRHWEVIDIDVKKLGKFYDSVGP